MYHQKKNRIKYIFAILPVLFITVFNIKPGFSLYYTNGVNNPNGQTLKEKTFFSSFLTYNGGGVQSKLLISIFDALDLGISFDIQRAIGDQKPNFSVPGVIAKLKLTSGTNTFPIFIAIGYDSFFTDTLRNGENSSNLSSGQTVFNTQAAREIHLDGLIYGPYFAITKPVYLFNFEQYVNMGIRVPVQPEYNKENIALFFGYDLPLGKDFIFKTEIDRIYLNEKKYRQILYNFGIQYFVIKSFSISFYLMTSVKRPSNKMLAIQYQTTF